MAWRKKGMGKKKGMKSKARMASAGVIRAPRKAPKVIGKVNVKALANAVSKLTCEKKEYQNFVADNTVGQFTASATGVVSSAAYFTADLMTPSPSIGTGPTNRIGNEISVTGIYSTFSFKQQANCSQKVRGKIIYLTPRMSSNGAYMDLPNIFNANYIPYMFNGSSVYDLQSTFNPNNMGNYKILRTKRFSVSSDQASLSQKLTSTFTCGLKFKTPHKIRFNSAGTVVQG